MEYSIQRLTKYVSTGLLLGIATGSFYYYLVGGFYYTFAAGEKLALEDILFFLIPATIMGTIFAFIGRIDPWQRREKILRRVMYGYFVISATPLVLALLYFWLTSLRR